MATWLGEIRCPKCFHWQIPMTYCPNCGHKLEWVVVPDDPPIYPNDFVWEGDMMRKKVELSFILDETGSMAAIRADTIGSFNTFLTEQKALDADVTFSLAMFSQSSAEEMYRPRHESVLLTDVEPLTEKTYRPRGTTPLLDAIGGTIDSLGARLADMPTNERPDQVIIVILTDGYENASREYTSEQIHEKIDHQRDVYKWEFVFLGAGIDAHVVAGDLGIQSTLTTSHDATPKGIRQAYATASCTVQSLVSDPSGTGG